MFVADGVPLLIVLLRHRREVALAIDAVLPLHDDALCNREVISKVARVIACNL